MPYKNKDGTKWIAQVRKDGERQNKVFHTKKDAMDWEAKMRRKPVSDWLKKTDMVCIGDWSQRYLDFAKSSFSVKTYDEKRSVFKRFQEDFDPVTPVSQVKMADVMTYILTQKEKRSGYAANKDRKNLVAGWNWGMKYMNPPLPGPNPCLVERMPEVRQPRYIPPEEDFWKIYEVAEGQDKIMLLSYLHLAARRGEIFRLTWEDVNFGNNRVRLWTRKRKGGVIEFDWLPMTKELRKSLMWWWEHRPIKDSPYVFVCLEDKQFCKDHYGEPFKERSKFMGRLCDKVGVKPFGFHAIRHLSASILYNLGYEVAVIQAILRHKSANTTERYLRSIGLERVREALEDLKPSNTKVLKFKQKRDSGNKVSKK
ncbi:MAG: site-specific integrase [Deltaproteobacteria bacterium]|nr:site-specific integrase [Deltaproteobacteria bacterium]